MMYINSILFSNAVYSSFSTTHHNTYTILFVMLDMFQSKFQLSHLIQTLPQILQLSHLLILVLVLFSFRAHTIIEQAICFQNLFIFIMLGVLFLGLNVKLVLVVAIDRKEAIRGRYRREVGRFGQQAFGGKYNLWFSLLPSNY